MIQSYKKLPGGRIVPGMLNKNLLQLNKLWFRYQALTDHVEWKADGDMSKIENMLGALALILADQIRDATNQVSSSRGETVAAIVTIGDNQGIVIRDLAEAVGLSHSGTVRLSNRLELDGLIERSSGDDLRTISMRLTPAGWDLRSRALSNRAQILAKCINSINECEVNIFERCLEAILADLVCERAIGYRMCRLCDEHVCVPFGCPVDARWEERFGTGGGLSDVDFRGQSR